MKLKLFISAAVALILFIAWWFNATPGPKAEPKSASLLTQQAASKKDLIGTWTRNDGGYSVKVVGFDQKGQIQVEYYNPQPIQVTHAKYFEEDGDLGFEFNLTGNGYDGNSYRLKHFKRNNMLYGSYFMKGTDSSFDVVFSKN
jgi:hypothetical protein